MRTDLSKILGIFAFLSPFTELFPEFGLSYFLPRNQDKVFYDQRLSARLLTVILVWTPIALKLYQISKIRTILAIPLIMTGFYLKRLSKHHTQDNLSPILYTLGLSIIALTLRDPIFLILMLIGGSLMSQGRTGSLKIDWLGRIIFSIGFLRFIARLN